MTFERKTQVCSQKAGEVRIRVLCYAVQNYMMWLQLVNVPSLLCAIAIDIFNVILHLCHLKGISCES